LPGDVVRLEDVGWTMTDASLCGLGQTAASAVLSAMKLWPELFEVGQMSKVESLKVSKVSKTKPKVAIKSKKTNTNGTAKKKSTHKTLSKK
jgi:hypothetical protein